MLSPEFSKSVSQLRLFEYKTEAFEDLRTRVRACLDHDAPPTDEEAKAEQKLFSLIDSNVRAKLDADANLTGHRFLIVGAGPAGLIAAQLLLERGASVRIFDRFPESRRLHMVDITERSATDTGLPIKGLKPLLTKLLGDGMTTTSTSLNLLKAANFAVSTAPFRAARREASDGDTSKAVMTMASLQRLLVIFLVITSRHRGSVEFRAPLQLEAKHIDDARLAFQQDSSTELPFLIGADGAHSVVRSYLIENSLLRASGPRADVIEFFEKKCDTGDVSRGQPALYEMNVVAMTTEAIPHLPCADWKCVEISTDDGTRKLQQIDFNLPEREVKDRFPGLWSEERGLTSLYYRPDTSTSHLKEATEAADLFRAQLMRIIPEKAEEEERKQVAYEAKMKEWNTTPRDSRGRKPKKPATKYVPMLAVLEEAVKYVPILEIKVFACPMKVLKAFADPSADIAFEHALHPAERVVLLGDSVRDPLPSLAMGTNDAYDMALDFVTLYENSVKDEIELDPSSDDWAAFKKREDKLTSMYLREARTKFKKFDEITPIQENIGDTVDADGDASGTGDDVGDASGTGDDVGAASGTDDVGAGESAGAGAGAGAGSDSV